MSIIILITYIAFISLGLPDSMLGVSFPQMRIELMAGVHMAGIMSITTTVATIISSTFSNKALAKFGTGIVTFASVLITALSIYGIAFAKNIYVVMLFAIPLGIGGGAIDAGLNGFISKFLPAKHMSFLHSFWGVGVTISPLIMSLALSLNGTWRTAYFILGTIQCFIALIMFFAIKKFNKIEKANHMAIREETTSYVPFKVAIKIKGVIIAMLCFCFYCAIEFMLLNYSTSFLVEVKHISHQISAELTSLFFLGMTIGRLTSGFVTEKMEGNKQIRLGLVFIAIALGIFVTLESVAMQAVALFLFGLGCAPIFPCLMSRTSKKFGLKNTQAVIGLQISAAYFGGAGMTAVLGLIAKDLSLAIMPIFIGIGLALLIVLTEISEYLARKTNA